MTTSDKNRDSNFAFGKSPDQTTGNMPGGGDGEESSPNPLDELPVEVLSAEAGNPAADIISPLRAGHVNTCSTSHARSLKKH